MNHSMLHFISMVNSFPIGKPAKTRDEILSKVSVISYLSRFQDQFSGIERLEERENKVRIFLGEVLGLEKEETIPGLFIAEKILGVSPGFLQDIGKVQLVKENDPRFNQFFDVLAESMGLINSPSNQR